MKRRSILILALILVLTLLPFGVQATESKSATIPFRVNPLYQGIYTPEAPSGPAPGAEVSGEYTYSYERDVLWAGEPMTVEEAAAALRKQMAARNEVCEILVWGVSSDYNATLDAVFAHLFDHTGNPKEGDYLAWQIGGYGGEVYDESRSEGYAFRYLLNMDYYTTAAQEAELDTAVKNLLNSLGVSGMSDYQKVKAVYDYMINNITYDEAHLNDETYTLQFTAYAALINKTAVCQGYANLLYRLLLEMGIDCRVIAGEVEGGAHGWNICKLGNVYYNLDATWDAGYDDYVYFLRNSEGFADHYRYLEYMTTQFHTDYPMSATDYEEGVEGEPEHIYVYGMCGEDAYFTVDRDGVLTILGTGATADFDQSMNDGNGSIFRYWTDGVTSIIIEDGITRVGTCSFYFMTNVTSVQLPNTLITIGDWGFTETDISTANLPDSLTSIGTCGFSFCDQLSSINFGSGLKTIGSNAFEACTALKEIQFPEGLESIGTNAFMECDQLTEVSIPSTVTFLSGFCGCDNLTTVHMENSQVAEIDGYAFERCTKLKNITLPDTLTKIGPCAFENCDSLTEITIPASVTSLGGSEFRYCDGLKKAVLLNTYVESNMFLDCVALETVTLGENIANILADAFANCTSLKEIYFTGDAPSISPNAFYGVTATAYYPASNPTWNEGLLQGYGGILTWVNNHTHEFTESAPVFDLETKTHSRYCPSCDTDVADACTFETVGSTEATTSNPGITTYTCTVCGGSYEESFPLRLYGANRYETAFIVADTLKDELGVEKFENIVVANGKAFADALAGSYLAVQKNAPILLTNQNLLEDVAAYIEANLASGGTVYLLGGTSAVPAEMEELLEGLNIVRLAGENRYETNLLILEEAGIGDEEILICTGRGFADSLSASAVGKPILLVNKTLYEDQKEFLEATSGEFVIIGGESAVSAALAEELEDYGNVDRLSGANRFETSVLVAEHFFDAPSSAVLAYSQNFPDGLCGGPLAAAMDAPLLLIATNRGPGVVEYANETGISCGAVLGGTGLIDDATAREVFGLDENATPMAK